MKKNIKLNINAKPVPNTQKPKISKKITVTKIKQAGPLTRSQNLNQFQRFYGRKITEETTEDEIKSSLQDFYCEKGYCSPEIALRSNPFVCKDEDAQSYADNAYAEAREDSEKMQAMLKLLNDQDKRVEVCPNYNKEKIIAKLEELSRMSDDFRD